MEKQKVFLVLGDSESGDHYQYVASKNPSKKLLKKLARYWDSDEDLDGPGDYGSYVYLEVVETEVDEELDWEN